MGSITMQKRVAMARERSVKEAVIVYFFSAPNLRYIRRQILTLTRNFRSALWSRKVELDSGFL